MTILLQAGKMTRLFYFILYFIFSGSANVLGSHIFPQALLPFSMCSWQSLVLSAFLNSLPSSAKSHFYQMTSEGPHIGTVPPGDPLAMFLSQWSFCELLQPTHTPHSFLRFFSSVPGLPFLLRGPEVRPLSPLAFLLLGFRLRSCVLGFFVGAWPWFVSHSLFTSKNISYSHLTWCEDQMEIVTMSCWKVPLQ